MGEDSNREKLLALLKDRSFSVGDVVLASGAKSDWFIDCKQSVLTAEGHWLVGQVLFAAVQQEFGDDVAAVAGVELGGCPLASSVRLPRIGRIESSTRFTFARERRLTERESWLKVLNDWHLGHGFASSKTS